MAANDTKDSLGRYLAAAKNYPRITRERERELSQIIQDSTDKVAKEEAVNELIEANLFLVVNLATKYANSHMDQTLCDTMDLISEGNKGLRKAALGYDSFFETNFSTYAVPAIKREMIRAYNTCRFIRIPADSSTIWGKVSRCAQKGRLIIAELENGNFDYYRAFTLITSSDVEDTDRAEDILLAFLELPNYLFNDDWYDFDNEKLMELYELYLEGYTLERIKRTIFFYCNPVQSLDEPLGTSEDGESFTLKDYYPATHDTKVVENIEEREFFDAILEEIRRMDGDKRQSSMVAKIFTNPDATLDELAEKEGLSRERIRQYFDSVRTHLYKALREGRWERRKDVERLPEHERRRPLSYSFTGEELDPTVSLEELKGLAEDIRLTIFGNDDALSIEEYTRRATELPAGTFGYRHIRAVHHEPLMEQFFPTPVYNALMQKRDDHLYFKESDEAFIRANLHHTTAWLAKKFYSQSHLIARKLKKDGLKAKRRQHIWTDEEIEFIKKNAHMGVSWLTEKLGNPDIRENAVRCKARNLGIKFYGVEYFTPEEDEFLLKNYKKGTEWLQKKLKRSRATIRSRAKKLNIKIPAIKNGKRIKPFTRKEDRLIKEYAETRGTRAIHLLKKELHRPSSSISTRAARLGVKFSKDPITPFFEELVAKRIAEHGKEAIPILAEEMHRSIGGVKKICRQLGYVDYVRERNRYYNPATWTQEELEFLRDNAPQGAAWLANHMNRTEAAILCKARDLKMTLKRPCQHYTQEEDDFLRANAKKGVAWIANSLGRSILSVEYRGKSLGVKIPKLEKPVVPFSEQEDKRIIEEVSKGGQKAMTKLSKELNRTFISIKARVNELDLYYPNMNFSPKQDELIRKCFATMEEHEATKFLCEKLTRSRKSLRQRARKLGIHTSVIDYSPEEDANILAILNECGEEKGFKMLHEKTKRPVKGLKDRARSLGYRFKKGQYTKEDMEYIREKVHALGIAAVPELAEKFGKTERQIKTKLWNMGFRFRVNKNCRVDQEKESVDNREMREELV